MLLEDGCFMKKLMSILMFVTCFNAQAENNKVKTNKHELSFKVKIAI